MLGDTVMDVYARYHRMAGHPTLWVPGLDHAGLATHVAVRRALIREGVRLEDLPREEAVAHIEKWRAAREARIREQTLAGGFSVDWSRYRYTMDPASVRATREVFVRLHREGLIYRAERMVNWDPRLRTAISDLEVKHSEETGTLVYLQYPWADGSPGASRSRRCGRRRSSAMSRSRSIPTTRGRPRPSAGRCSYRSRDDRSR